MCGIPSVRGSIVSQLLHRYIRAVLVVLTDVVCRLVCIGILARVPNTYSHQVLTATVGMKYNIYAHSDVRRRRHDTIHVRDEIAMEHQTGMRAIRDDNPFDSRILDVELILVILDHVLHFSTRVGSLRTAERND